MRAPQRLKSAFLLGTLMLIFVGCTSPSQPSVDWPEIAISMRAAEDDPGWMFLDFWNPTTTEVRIADFTVIDNATNMIVARPEFSYEPYEWEWMRTLQGRSRSSFGFPGNPSHPHTAMVTLELEGQTKSLSIEYAPEDAS